MDLVRAYEEAAGAVVKDVHTPELARAAGLTDNPGFDHAVDSAGGRAPGHRGQGPGGHGRRGGQLQRVGQGRQSRDGYWIYAVYDCATPAPRLARVQDPFGSSAGKSQGQRADRGQGNNVGFE